MYELVFTNFRTNVDLTGEHSEEGLVEFIITMIKDGKLALTELRKKEAPGQG